MADDTGFLDTLGIGSVDERSAVDAQRQNAFKGQAAQNFQLGRMAAPLVGAAATAVGGLISGRNEGRTFSGMKRNLAAGAETVRDTETARATGLTVKQLRDRRAMRTELGKFKPTSDSSFGRRMEVASKAAELANNRGDVESLGKSLAALDSMRAEEQEFNKLSADASTAQSRAENENVTDVWLAGDTKPRTAVLKNGSAHYTNQNGELIEAPAGTYSTVDPLKGSAQAETLDQRWRKIVPASERSAISNMINTGSGALRQYRRVLSTIIDLSADGGVNSVLSTSGSVLSSIDNIARNVQGIMEPVLGAFSNYNGKKTKSTEVRSDILKRGIDSTSDFWVNAQGENILPPEFRQASAAAQQHRAMIMELAYLAARMAEPSNRGLSDNDIKNAMQRIAGGTSNPQVMMRRFAEMVFDGASAIDDVIGVHRGKFPDISDEQFDEFVGGDTYAKYKSGLTTLADDFSFNIDRDGRAKFVSPLDSDVAPGAGIPGLATAPGEDATTELSDDDFLSSFDQQ